MRNVFADPAPAVRVAAILVTVLSLWGSVVQVRAEDDSTDKLATNAVEFCRLFMDGEDEKAQALMAEKMRSAVTPELAAQIRASLTGLHGAMQQLGEAWLEDQPQGYKRFRVPAEFEKHTLDLRVVFDDAGKVAGFFQVPHVERPDEAQAERAEPATPAAPNPAVEGHWEGKIETPGPGLPVVVDLTFSDGAWSGSFDSPMQGATGIPLEGILVEGTKIRFSIQGIPGKPTFEGKLEAGVIEGTFTQMGQSFAFSLGREQVALPPRPQEPQPPFPYDTREVEYANGEITIACTLTLPRGEGAHPAVHLITGSGPQDRDEAIFGHKPFLVLSDDLARAGLAVLRCDDRGVGGSGGALSTSTTAELAEDAVAALRFLKAQPGIDPQRIGLVGHSEGGIIAPLIASRSADVAFVVMLAGPGVPGQQILVRQTELLLRAGGVSGEEAAGALAAQHRLLDLVVQGADEQALHEPYRELAALQFSAAGSEIDPAALDQAITAGVAELTTPWFRFFLTHDPRPALRQVKVPVLALNGELDLQVDPGQNLPEITRALEQAGNPDVTVKELPRLNHLFQEARSGAVAEYASIEETINPLALKTIREWIVQRFVSD
jgi:pimeloyl-ACP methyl ester carboxylesterase